MFIINLVHTIVWEEKQSIEWEGAPFFVDEEKDWINRSFLNIYHSLLQISNFQILENYTSLHDFIVKYVKYNSVVLGWNTYHGFRKSTNDLKERKGTIHDN